MICVVFVGGVTHAVVIRHDLFASLARPIDGGLAIGGRPVFGPHKTWRGVVVMTAGSALGGVLLLPPVGVTDSLAAGAATGALLGLVYVAAELPNSFVKRRLGIDAGHRAQRLSRLQYLIDQADSVVGFTIAITFLYPVTLRDLALLLLAGIGVHIVFDLSLHATGVKGRTS